MILRLHILFEKVLYYRREDKFLIIDRCAAEWLPEHGKYIGPACWSGMC